MPRKILITGGCGYLGCVIAETLLNAGDHVTILDNLSNGVAGPLHLANRPAFRFVLGDARDESLLKKLMADADVIIPLAAIVGMKACESDPGLARSVNLDAVKLMLKLRSHSQWVVSPCTNSGYGAKSGALVCTEETPMEPISVYGETKVHAENEILSKDNTISLRLATVFGPSTRIRLDLLVNDFTYRALTDGFIVIYQKDFKRNYVHIQDVADAFVHCIKNFQSMKGRPYNLGLSSANLSKAELAEVIKKHIPNFYVHYAEVGTDPDKRNYIVLNDRIKATGFEASRSLDLGISQLLNVYKMLPRSPYKNA